MAMAVFAPSSPGLAKKKKPDQRADRYQQEGAGHDEKIHPSRGYPAYGWQCIIHGVKKSVVKNMPVKSHALSSGVLSPKSMFSRCIR